MSMRSLFCTSCAAVALTAGVYYTADWACKHPDSLAGRCAREALHISSPVHQIAAHLGEAAAPKPDCCEQSCEVVVPAPVVEPQEVIDLNQECVSTPPIAVASPEADKEGIEPIESQVEGVTAPVVVVAPCDVEECEVQKPVQSSVATDPDMPATMPPCAEDEAPATKKASCTSSCHEETASCDSAWWFFEEADACPDKQPMCDEPESKPAADKGEAEESEPIMGGKPSDCQVDPNYPQQYPACPYMGKSVPSMKMESEEATPPEKKSHKKKTKQATHEESSETPMPEALDGMAPPQDPSIDTMEFRKTDAKKGEFKPKTW